MDTKELHLSFVDQNIVRVYTQLFLLFPFPDAGQSAAATQSLADGLQVTLRKFPFLAGMVRLADAQSGKLSLVYPAETPDVQKSSILAAKTLSFKEFSHTYGKLKKMGMPPSAITGKIFCPDNLRRYPSVPPDGNGIVDHTKKEAPAMNIQVVYIPGGLVLGIYMHHAVMDFPGMNTFWEHWASNVYSQKHGLSTCNVSLCILDECQLMWTALPDPPDQSVLRKQLDARGSKFTEPLNTECMSYINGKNKYATNLPPDAPCSQKLFAISAERIRNFREQLQDEFGCRITICNIITALLWIYVTRTRTSRLAPEDYIREKSSIGISANARRRMTPELSDDYTGNIALFTKCTSSVADLIEDKM